MKQSQQAGSERQIRSTSLLTMSINLDPPAQAAGRDVFRKPQSSA
jgi:hypothetical protein